MKQLAAEKGTEVNVCLIEKGAEAFAAEMQNAPLDLLASADVVQLEPLKIAAKVDRADQDGPGVVADEAVAAHHDVKGDQVAVADDAADAVGIGGPVGR